MEQNDEGFVVGLGNESTGERLTRVKLYKTAGKVDLSAFMPILEALGLRVGRGGPDGVARRREIYIHDFGVLDSRGAVLDLEHAAAAWRRRSSRSGAVRLNPTR
jgi:NAD-specific glutamate dehydrogenase